MNESESFAARCLIVVECIGCLLPTRRQEENVFIPSFASRFMLMGLIYFDFFSRCSQEVLLTWVKQLKSHRKKNRRVNRSKVVVAESAYVHTQAALKHHLTHGRLTTGSLIDRKNDGCGFFTYNSVYQTSLTLSSWR